MRILEPVAIQTEGGRIHFLFTRRDLTCGPVIAIMELSRHLIPGKIHVSGFISKYRYLNQTVEPKITDKDPRLVELGYLCGPRCSALIFSAQDVDSFGITAPPERDITPEEEYIFSAMDVDPKIAVTANNALVSRIWLCYPEPPAVMSIVE